MRARATPAITMDVRLEANGILDRLTEDGDTFPADLAERLAAILPMTRRPSRVQAELTTTSRSGAVQGATTTGHMASTDGGDTRTLTVGSDGSFRVGQWKVSHQPGEIEITRVMQGYLPETCLLRYSPHTGQAVEMSWPRRWTLRVGSGVVAVMFGWRRWKVPARPGTVDAAHAGRPPFQSRKPGPPGPG